MAKKTKIPLHRDPFIRSLIIQITIPLLLLWGLYTIFQNTVTNLAQRGIKTSFEFLHEVAPFAIGFSPFWTFELGKSTYFDVFIIGIQNTIIVAVLGIIAATILGFIIGVMRLSPNWLISRFALVYIEVMRNVPLLLQIIFWNFAIFLAFLPGPRQSLEFLNSIFLNGRGLYLPKPIVNDQTGFFIFLAAIVATIIGIFILRRWARNRQDKTGKRFPTGLAGLGALFIIGALALAATGWPISLELPELKRFNFEGGIELPLPLFSLWFALSIYTAAFIAENVRGGIQSVSHGQTEASKALGLPRGLMMQKIIIPQAMRVIIPPTISQYLNLTKNSSLAVAVAYEETVAIFAGIALNQTGQAVSIIFMTMAVYITLSLLTSLTLNIYNRSVQLVER